MSRVGRNPVLIPDNVKAEVNQGELTITGPKGKLSHRFHPRVKVEIKEKKILITRQSDSNLDKSIHGLTRSITNNMVIGATEGFSKQLEIIGVGFRAQIQNNILTLRLGFSHVIDFPIPEGISIELPKPTQIKVSGIDKRLVGEVAAKIRSFYPPEPYKGKGIRYSGEYVRHKVGKAVA